MKRVGKTQAPEAPTPATVAPPTGERRRARSHRVPRLIGIFLELIGLRVIDGIRVGDDSDCLRQLRVLRIRLDLVRGVLSDAEEGRERVGEVGRPAGSREADGEDGGEIVSADHSRSHDSHGGHLHHVLEERASTEVARGG